MSALFTLILVALGGRAARADEAGALRTWSTSALEATPDFDGEVWGRARQQIRVEASAGEGAFGADMAIVLPPGRMPVTSFAVHQITYDRAFAQGDLRVGRMVRLDSRGWMPVDGVSFDAEGTPFFKPSVVIGRLWSPEPGEAPSTWVGGVSLKMHPGNGEGEASRAVGFTAGWLGRLHDEGLSHSLAAGASWRGTRGSGASLDGELRVGGGEDGARAGLRANLPLGRHLTLAPELRWEDLAPATDISGLRTPIDWLGGEGYAVASLAARATAGPLALTASGGPVLHQDETGMGGLGRGGLGWRGERGSAGVFGSAAAIGGSWLAGGGVEGGLSAFGAEVDGQIGLFRFQPLAGEQADVGELRLRGTRPLVAERGGAALDLSLEAAMGMDRLLEPWSRAALVLEGQIGEGGGS